MNIFHLTYIIWILSELILNRLVRSGKSDKKGADKNTELYLWLSIILFITSGVFVAIYYSAPISFNNNLNLIGLIIITIGIIIRVISIKQLGRFFTVNVTIRKDHQLIQNGFYNYIRHPSYTGSLLSFLGFGFSLNNWLSLILVFMPILLSFIHRMNIEEKVLTEQFGKEYSDYIKRTKRLIPFLY